MDIQQYMRQVGQQAREASRLIARADTHTKNTALYTIAAAIRRHSTALLLANQEDLAAARAAGLEPAMLDRLTLTEKGVAAMADGVEQIAAVSEGVLKMEHGEALVLVDTIERPEEIDLHRAEEMAAEARAELKAKRSAQEQAIANARIARAISRIHVKHDGK